MKLRDILARRETLRTEMRGLDTAANGGALADAAQTRWAAIEGELATLDSQEKRQAQLDDLDRRAAGAPVGDAKFNQFSAEVSISDAIAAVSGMDTRGAGQAREVSAEIARQRGKNPQGIYISAGSRAAGETRAITSGAQGTPAAGAALIPTIVRGDLLIDVLRANLVLTALGATFLTGLRGNISIPQVTQGTAVGWFAENQNIPDTDMAFGSVGLQVKHVGAISEYSRNMLLNSTPDIDALIRRDLMASLAREIERAAIAGSGDGVTPRGILNTPGVKQVVMGNTLSWPGVLALPASLDNSNVPMTSPGFIGSGLIRAKAMATQTVPGVASPFIMGAPDVLAGYPFAATNIVPVTPATTGAGAHPALSTLVYGSWDSLLIGMFGDGAGPIFDLTSNPYAEGPYRRGAVQVRIIADCDVAVRHPEAFAYASDVAA